MLFRRAPRLPVTCKSLRVSNPADGSYLPCKRGPLHYSGSDLDKGVVARGNLRSENVARHASFDFDYYENKVAILNV